MAEISNIVNEQISNNFIEKVISALQDYLIVLIICICVFIIINITTCSIVILNRKSIKKIENKIKYL